MIIKAKNRGKISKLKTNKKKNKKMNENYMLRLM